jgi:hypothetical protein
MRNIIEIVARILIKVLIPIYFLALITWGAIQSFNIQREKLQTERFKVLIENSASVQIVPQPQTPGSQI